MESDAAPGPSGSARREQLRGQWENTMARREGLRWRRRTQRRTQQVDPRHDQHGRYSQRRPARLQLELVQHVCVGLYVLRAETTRTRSTPQRTRGVGASSSFHSNSTAPAGICRTRNNQTLASHRHCRRLCRGGKTKPRLRAIGRRALHWQRQTGRTERRSGV